jgi:molybdenum cofactor biosynthesis enzyme MoaA
MKIQTLSVITGTKACNACCPFCISKMTHSGNVKLKPSNQNWRNFKIAMKLAIASGVTTVMLTGKGEPTLWVDLIDQYLAKINGAFPFIELQTNGMAIHDLSDSCLKRWYDKGMTTIAISVCHWRDNENQKIYCPCELPLPKGRGFLSKTSKHFHSRHFEIRAVPALIL